MRALFVLDGTIDRAEVGARTLDAFLAEGLAGVAPAETVLLYGDDDDLERLLELAPTPVVHLVRLPPRRPDLSAAVVSEMALGGDLSVIVTPGGATGTELAARLACRSGGTALTDVLSARAAAGRLECTKAVYSNHMVGRFELQAPPYCLSVDASWADRSLGDEPERPAAADAGTGRRIASETDVSADAGDGPFRDLALEAPPSNDELAASRFLVVAGRGAGSSERVARIAAAAARLEAAFGVTRPVVMNGWAPMDRLIGVSGVRTSPAVCIVAGASGAAAFQWGIERAGFIVALNPDGRAPMVADADVAVLDDGVSVLEELTAIVEAWRED